MACDAMACQGESATVAYTSTLVSTKSGSASVVTIHILTAQRQIFRPVTDVIYRQLRRSFTLALYRLLFEYDDDPVLSWGNVKRHLHSQMTVSGNRSLCFDGSHTTAYLSLSITRLPPLPIFYHRPYPRQRCCKRAGPDGELRPLNTRLPPQ